MAEPSRMTFGLAVLLSPLTCHKRTPSTSAPPNLIELPPLVKPHTVCQNGSIFGFCRLRAARSAWPGKITARKERISHKKAPAARQSRSCHAGFLLLLEKSQLRRTRPAKCLH